MGKPDNAITNQKKITFTSSSSHCLPPPTHTHKHTHTHTTHTHTHHTHTHTPHTHHTHTHKQGSTCICYQQSCLFFLSLFLLARVDLGHNGYQEKLSAKLGKMCITILHHITLCAGLCRVSWSAAAAHLYLHFLVCVPDTNVTHITRSIQ